MLLWMTCTPRTSIYSSDCKKTHYNNFCHAEHTTPLCTVNFYNVAKTLLWLNDNVMTTLWQRYFFLAGITIGILCVNFSWIWKSLFVKKKKKELRKYSRTFLRLNNNVMTTIFFLAGITIGTLCVIYSWIWMRA